MSGNSIDHVSAHARTLVRCWLTGSLLAIGLTIGAPAAFAAESAGATGFNSTCAFCHQTAGQGLPGQFPRIAGRVNTIAATPAGRKYLSAVVLYGMSGQITVDGAPIVGVMPPFEVLGDQTLADILNYVMRFSKKGKVAPFTAAEIKAQRHDPPLSASAVFAMRGELKPSEAIQH